MSAANTLRLKIEHALESRFPSALSPSPRVEPPRAATGIATVDDLLAGGLPIGAISELTGPDCSGRTSLALAFLAQRTRDDQVCAWVDAADTFDPESAAANGVALRQLLWIRCGATSRLAAQRAADFKSLDQAIRATDLLLQAGGFCAIILDLGSTPPAQSRRIPLATWFRFRQASMRAQCSLVVVGQTVCAQSSAHLVLECSRLRANSTGGTVLTGFTSEVRRERGIGAKPILSISCVRKPPVSTWTASAAWTPNDNAEQRA